jgi:hypothetical protein
MDVTVRAAAYFDILERGEFIEFKRTRIPWPDWKRRGK